MIYKFKHILIFIFITCLVTLTLQSAIVSVYKNCKISKTQTNLNNQPAEEEEASKEKECGSDGLFYELSPLITGIQVSINLVWPLTEVAFSSHPSDILIPPPKV